jgi:putative SOS response-associated peptidase YedK
VCGRIIVRTPLAEIGNLFETTNPVPNMAPNYNGAPTDNLPVVRLDRDGRRSLDLLRWGLIPAWSKDAKIGPRCINAQAETVATKPAFRDAFRRRRCLVPVDGFYEWRKLTGGGKQPYAIVASDGLSLALACLWERWKDPAARDLTDLRHRHVPAERALRDDPHPHACDPAARGVGELARRRDGR